MLVSQIVVTLAGLGAIAWVYWYFFVATRGSATVVESGARLQEATIVVDGGYAPAVIAVRAGRPVRLHFDRRDRGSCTEEVLLPDFGIRRFLPTSAVTTVEFTPAEAGRFDFSCGMGMVHGTLRVDG